MLIIADLLADSECSLGQFHLLMVGSGLFSDIIVVVIVVIIDCGDGLFSK